jgi:hypothetical protein
MDIGVVFVSVRSVLLSYERQNDALTATSSYIRLLRSYVVLSTVRSVVDLTSGMNVYTPEEAS